MKTKTGERIYTAKELATLGTIMAAFLDSHEWVDVVNDDTLVLDGMIGLTDDESALVLSILAGD